MKLKKIFLVSSIIPLLASCNTSDISGMYVFQLGKDTGTHIGAFLNLKNTEYKPADGTNEEGYKNFDLAVSFQMNTGDEESEFSKEIQDFLETIKDEIDGQSKIPGYYKRSGEVTKTGEERIIMGVDFVSLVDKSAEYIKKQLGDDFDIDTIKTAVSDLNNEGVLQSLLYATYKEETMNFYIPVSVEDAYYQVYWYGYDVQVKIQLEEVIPFDINVVEVEKHSFGTHPTKEEIAKINETFKQTHEDMFITTFRDYNSLKLGLSKR